MAEVIQRDWTFGTFSKDNDGIQRFMGSGECVFFIGIGYWFWLFIGFVIAGVKMGLK